MTDQTAIIDAPAAIESAVASTGRELVPVPTEISLDQRAASINRYLDSISRAEDRAESLRLSAGRELIAARKRVPPGEWLAWCKANIKRGQRDIQRLMKIAGADDPEKALEKDNAGARERMAANRAKATNVRRMRGGGEDGTEPSPEQYRFAYFNRADHAMRFAFLPDKAPKPDQEMLEWADQVIEDWVKLRADLKERMGVAKPTVVPLYRDDGVTPICNCELDAEKKDETRATVNGLLHAMLDGELTVRLDPFQKRKMVFVAEMKRDGWDIQSCARRKKTKAEIADFEAREKALHDAPAGTSGYRVTAVMLDESDIAADPALAASWAAKKAAEARAGQSIAELCAAEGAHAKLEEAALAKKMETAIAAEQPAAIAAE